MTAIGDIEFLARLEGRVRVLRLLAERPHTRAELQAATDIPRATVGRIVTYFEERGLVTNGRHRKGCEASPLGWFLAGELGTLLDRTEAMRNVHRVSRWFPIEALDFRPDRLADAIITTPRHGDPTAPIRHAAVMTRTAEHVEFISNAFIPYLHEEIRERTVRGEQTAVGVLTDAVFDTIRSDQEMAEMARETLRSERATFYRYSAACPYTLVVVDRESVGIVLLDAEDNVRGLVGTEDDVIPSWAASTVEDHRREATVLGPDDFVD